MVRTSPPVSPPHPFSSQPQGAHLPCGISLSRYAAIPAPAIQYESSPGAHTHAHLAMDGERVPSYFAVSRHASVLA
eukprot:scaffold19800_cov73-Isochrysis_galbana.AAC.1